MNDFGISDVAGLSQPLTKLIESISFGVGKFYEPIHIKRMAKAKTNEIQLISDAVNKNINLPINYSSGEVDIDTTNANELMQRTGNRLLYQEMQKQQNIESIIATAYSELDKETTVSDEPIDKDWILRFFNSIEDVSNQKMQEIWGKILAGEIKQPNTYSLRTLEKLKNISQYEAQLFQKIAELVMCCSNTYFLFKNKEVLDNYECYFDKLLLLEECGLITAQQLILKNEISKGINCCVYNKKIIGILSSEKEEPVKVNLQIYKLTETGVELFKTIEVETNIQYTHDSLSKLKEQTNVYRVSAHKINFITENGIDYDDIDLLQKEGK